MIIPKCRYWCNFIHDANISQVWNIISLYLILLKAFQSNLKLPQFSNQLFFPLARSVLTFLTTGTKSCSPPLSWTQFHTWFYRPPPLICQTSFHFPWKFLQSCFHCIIQGSYRSRKPWKVMEFIWIYRPGKSWNLFQFPGLESCEGHGK